MENNTRPQTKSRKFITPVRWLGAAILIFFGSSMNFVVFFSDYPSSWSAETWTLYLFAWHTLIPFLIGVLIPVAWYLALITLSGTALGLWGLRDSPAPFLGFAASVIAFAWLGSCVAIWLGRRAR